MAKTCIREYISLKEAHPATFEALDDLFKQRFDQVQAKLRAGEANRAQRKQGSNKKPRYVNQTPLTMPSKHAVELGQKLVRAVMSDTKVASVPTGSWPAPQQTTTHTNRYKNWAYAQRLVTKPTQTKAARCNLCFDFFVTGHHNNVLVGHLAQVHNVTEATPPGVVYEALVRSKQKHGDSAADLTIPSASPTSAALDVAVLGGSAYPTLDTFLGLKYKREEPKQLDFNNKLAMLMIECNLPFRLLSNPKFRQMLDPRALVPSAETFRTRDFPRLWTAHVEDLAATCERADSIAVITDGWTDRNMTRYVGIALSVTTLHPSGVLRETLPFDAPPLETLAENAVAVADHLVKALSGMRVPLDKVQSYMSDSARVALNVADHLPRLGINLPVAVHDLDPSGCVQRCAVHQVALVAKSTLALDTIKNTLALCKDIHSTFAVGSKARATAEMLSNLHQPSESARTALRTVFAELTDTLKARKRDWEHVPDDEDVVVTDDELFGALGDAALLATHSDATSMGFSAAHTVRQKSFSITNMVCTRFATLYSLLSSVASHGDVLVLMPTYYTDMPALTKKKIDLIGALAMVVKPLHDLCTRMSRDDLLLSQVPGLLTDTVTAIRAAASKHLDCEEVANLADVVVNDLCTRFPFLKDATLSPLHVAAAVLDPSTWRKQRLVGSDGTLSADEAWTPYWWVPGFAEGGLSGIKDVTEAVQQVLLKLGRPPPKEDVSGPLPSGLVSDDDDDDDDDLLEEQRKRSIRKDLKALISLVHRDYSRQDKTSTLPSAASFWTQTRRTDFAGLLDEQGFAFILSLVAHSIAVERLFSRLKLVDKPQRQHTPGQLNKRGVLMAKAASGRWSDPYPSSTTSRSETLKKLPAAKDVHHVPVIVVPDDAEAEAGAGAGAGSGAGAGAGPDASV